MAPQDRFGLGWRPELAAEIFTSFDRIDVLEVIADDYFRAPKAKVRALKTLARQKPVVLHGVGLGMASTAAVDRKRLDRFARLAGEVQPESWSEHLAFVRWGEREIGHLAAPPRNADTVESAAANLAQAERAIGARGAVENIATLIAPPASPLSEDEWIGGILRASGANLLLDLHNVHTNAYNFGYEAAAFLDRIPMERVTQIHIAGGKLLEEGLILDDHKHDVPDPVYELLERVAAKAPQPLTVILERDGEYPPLDAMLAELDRARAAVARGRAAA